MVNEGFTYRYSIFYFRAIWAQGPMGYGRISVRSSGAGSLGFARSSVQVLASRVQGRLSDIAFQDSVL